MLRQVWQSVKDVVYDSIQSIFRDQTEIDDLVDDELSNYGTVHEDVSTVPQAAAQRRREFYFSNDVIKYITDAGIPPSCVNIVKYPEYDEFGNTLYKVWIEPDTP